MKIQTLRDKIIGIEVLQKRCLTSSVSEILTHSDLPLSVDLSNEELSHWIEQSAELGSLERHLALSVCQFQRHGSCDPLNQLQLLKACLLAGRYQDVLTLRESFGLEVEDAWGLALLSAYRLGLFQNVIVYSGFLDFSTLDFDLQRLIIRSYLECGRFSDARCYLSCLKPLSPIQQQQAELLLLLSKLWDGQAASDDAQCILEFCQNLERGEWASLLPFWSQIYILLGRTITATQWFQRLERKAWLLLAEPKLLSSPRNPLPEYTPGSDCWKIGLVMDACTEAALNFVNELEHYLQLCDTSKNTLQLIPIFLRSGKSSPKTTLGSERIPLSGLSVAESVSLLRQFSLDIVLDQVGPFDSRWLLIAAQRVAPLQIAWFPVPVSIPQTSSYDGQLVDRWTAGQEEAGQIPQLILSGFRRPFPPLAPANIQNSKQHTVIDGQPVGLIVLGAPSVQLPGAALLLKRCSEILATECILFEHSSWQEQAVLEHWWTCWCQTSLPSHCQTRHGAFQYETGIRWIALDICSQSPVESTVRFLSIGIPVVNLPANHCSASGTAAVLSALGLDSLVRPDPEEWLEAVESLIANPQVYFEISQHLRHSMHTSLLFNVSQTAKDLVEAINLIRIRLKDSAFEHVAVY